MLCIVYFRVLSSHGIGMTVTQRRSVSDVGSRQQHESSSETDSALTVTHSCAQVTFTAAPALQ